MVNSNTVDKYKCLTDLIKKQRFIIDSQQSTITDLKKERTELIEKNNTSFTKSEELGKLIQKLKLNNKELLIKNDELINLAKKLKNDKIHTMSRIDELVEDKKTFLEIIKNKQHMTIVPVPHVIDSNKQPGQHLTYQQYNKNIMNYSNSDMDKGVNVDVNIKKNVSNINMVCGVRNPINTNFKTSKGVGNGGLISELKQKLIDRGGAIG